MHEMGVAMQMVEIALSSIPKNINNPRIKKINLKIGELTAIVEDSFKFCFKIITEDTPLKNAKLIIESVPVKAQCQNCNHTWDVKNSVFTCPGCEKGTVDLISGRELEILSLEIEE
ncbi:MAG: hydrogenase maturation nickel metallochaperone HypA [Desulfobacteraceae bacterium 4572_130]|nr:MAG: hydrogenase maturation nickel metallochaperone HypA [Desulfobacteraceae bacterium 4572_130]